MLPGAVNERKKRAVYHWFRIQYPYLRSDTAVDRFLKRYQATSYRNGRINWNNAYDIATTIQKDYEYDRGTWRREHYDGWLERAGLPGPEDDE